MSSKKQELKQNELATAIERYVEQIKPFTNVILLGVVAIVLVVLATVWFVRSAATKREAVWSEYLSASYSLTTAARVDLMREHADAHPDQDSGLLATLMTADFELAEGTDRLYRNREDGVERIEDAIAFYDELLGTDGSDGRAKKNDWVRNAALLGRGKAHEALLQVDDAVADYERVIESAGEESAIGQVAARRIRMIENTSGLDQFITEYLAYDGTETLESRPIDTGFLPPIPDISYPVSFDDPGNLGTTEGIINPDEVESGDPNGDGTDNGTPGLNSPVPDLTDPTGGGGDNAADPNNAGTSGSDNTTGGDTTGGDTTGDDTTGDDTTGGDSTGGGNGDDGSGNGNS